MSQFLSVLWVPNDRHPSGVKGSLGGKIILSSEPEQNAPSSECRTRTVLPEVYTYELCVLFDSPSGGSYIAYPEANAEAFKLPGVDDPIDIVWEKNDRHGFEDQFIASYVLPGGNRYFRIFPGDNNRLSSSPHPERTIAWPYPLQAGDQTMCWINWILSKDGIPVGYAYFATEAIREDNGVVQIDGTDIVIVNRRVAASIKAWWEKDGELHVVFTPLDVK